MSYFIEIIHKNGDKKYEGIYPRKPEQTLINLRKITFPNSKISAVEFFGIVSCCVCGNPVVLTNHHEADAACQMIDNRCCSDYCKEERVRRAGL